MYYLARNKEVVAEVKQLFHPERGIMVGDTSKTVIAFTTLGSFPSSVLNREVFVGIKEYQDPEINLWIIGQRAPLELATIAAIAEHVVELRDGLPSFYALLRDSKGKPTGILMEDFSQGGKYRVSSYKFVPPQIIDLFGADILDDDFICNMSFSVEGRIRYGDFYPFFQTFKKEEALARHPMSQAVRQVTRNMW